MGDACLCKRLINGQLGGHDGVVRRSEDSVDLVADKGFCCEHDFVHRSSGALDVFDALFLKIGFRGGDCGGGGIFADVVQQSDQIGVGIRCEDQVHDGVGVKIVGSARQVCTRRLEGFHNSRPHGVGHGGEYYGDLVVFGCGLHAHSHRRCDGDHQVHLVRDEVGDDLVHDVCVRIAVVFLNVKDNALFRADAVELAADVCNDLVERGIVNEVADAHFEGFALCESGGDADCGKGYDESQDQCCTDELFHGFLFLSFFYFLLFLFGLRTERKAKIPSPQLSLLGRE